MRNSRENLRTSSDSHSDFRFTSSHSENQSQFQNFNLISFHFREDPCPVAGRIR